MRALQKEPCFKPTLPKMASPGARSTGSAGGGVADSDRVKRRRFKRIPVADLELQSFQKERSVQGTIVLCEPQRNESSDSRYFLLKDIVVSSKAAISAAGLDPRESEERFEQQTKKRKQDTPVAHTIQVTLHGLFSTIPLSVNDVVMIKGSDVSVTINESKAEASDHHLQIHLTKGNAEIEVIPILLESVGARRKKPAASPSYSDKAARFYLDGEDLATEIRKIRKNHPEVDFVKLNDLKVNEEYQNTYGVVVNVNFPSKTQKGTWRLAIHLIDETHPHPEAPIEVCAFASKDSLADYLPEMTCLGTIVRLHRIKVSTFQEQKSMRMVSQVTTMTLASATPGDREQIDINLDGAESKTNLDWNRVEQLRSFAVGIVAQGGHPSFLYNKYMKTLTDVFNGPTEDRSMVDVMVRVASVPTATPNPEEGEGYFFEVTDGQTVATVVLRREASTEAVETPAHYWTLVTRFVGTKLANWIKIRNCQVVKNDRMLFVFCGDGNLKASSFLRIPAEFCQDSPRAAVAAPVNVPQLPPVKRLPKQVVSQVHASAQSMPLVPLSHVIGRLSPPPYRVQVRVSNLFPSDIAQLCRARADGYFAWKVALQLEDTTGRVDAVLTGDDATEFFQMQPLDLKANEESRKVVELTVTTMRSDNCWLDCVLVPLIETGQVFAIVDTVVCV